MSNVALHLVHGEGAGAPDGEVVGRVLAGDDDAYALLVQRHQRAIYRHARGMGLDHDTAVDLVQDAFVRAYDRLHACVERDRFGAWLFRIARNLCLDYLKNVRRQIVPLSSVADAGSIPDERSAISEEREVLRQALERLSPALREAFLLKHAAGYSYEEVARIMDVTPSAAKMRVHRARESLRDFLAGEGIGAA